MCSHYSPAECSPCRTANARWWAGGHCNDQYTMQPLEYYLPIKWKTCYWISRSSSQVWYKSLQNFFPVVFPQASFFSMENSSWMKIPAIYIARALSISKDTLPWSLRKIYHISPISPGKLWSFQLKFISLLRKKKIHIFFYRGSLLLTYQLSPEA